MSFILVEDENAECKVVDSNTAGRDEERQLYQPTTTMKRVPGSDPRLTTMPLGGERGDDVVSTGDVEHDHFPLKLHKLLEQLELEGKQHIIGWNPDGKSFAVFRPKEFAAEIMTKHFRRQSKYKSFQRQLNLYAFKRQSHGRIKGVYSHDFFVRDNRELCRTMKRERTNNKDDLGSFVGNNTIREIADSSQHSEESSSHSLDQGSTHGRRQTKSLRMEQEQSSYSLLASRYGTAAFGIKDEKLSPGAPMRSGSAETLPKKRKVAGDICRSSSEPSFIISSMDGDTKTMCTSEHGFASALVPTFDLREGAHHDTALSNMIAHYTQDDIDSMYHEKYNDSSPYLTMMGQNDSSVVGIEHHFVTLQGGNTTGSEAMLDHHDVRPSSSIGTRSRSDWSSQGMTGVMQGHKAQTHTQDPPLKSDNNANGSSSVLSITTANLPLFQPVCIVAGDQDGNPRTETYATTRPSTNLLDDMNMPMIPIGNAIISLGNMMDLTPHQEEEECGGSIGTIDDLENILGGGFLRQHSYR